MKVVTRFGVFEKAPARTLFLREEVSAMMIVRT
jgi:hypothetical protein